MIFAVIESKCFVIQFFISKSPFVATAASMNVPASIWSGTTEYVKFPDSFSTPFIFIKSVPAPRMSAPIAFRKFATSTIWGSFAALSIVVVPLASTADNITFIVAPTDTISIYIELPINLSAFACIVPLPTDTVAPRVSKPFMCWSIGLAPNLHPPGTPTSAEPHLPRSEPNK